MSSSHDGTHHKTDDFNKIVSKLNSLETQINSIAVAIMKSGSKTRHGHNKMKNTQGGKYQSKRKKDSRLACTRQRVSSLDLLANAVVQANGDSTYNTSESGRSASASTDNDTLNFFKSPTFSFVSTTGDFGVISSYAILAPKGLDWVKAKSLNSGLELNYLSSWYADFVKNKSTGKSLSVPDTLKPLPDVSIQEALIDIFKSSGLETLTFVCNDEITELFEEFKKGDSTNLKPSLRLIVNVVLALTCNIRLHCSTLTVQHTIKPELQNKVMLKELEELFISNALYYFHQIMVVPEGILSIQAMLSLIGYTDFSGALQASFMIVSLAVRQAQNLGLHTELSYQELGQEEVIKRRKLWWVCRHYDQKVAIILGRPPIVAEYDATTHFPRFNKCFELLTDVILGSSKDPKEYEDAFVNSFFKLVVETAGFETFAGFYLSRLANITALIYTKLYAVSTTMNLAKQLSKAKDLLDVLNTFRLSLPESLRPRVSIDTLHPLVFSEANGIPTVMRMYMLCNIHFSYYVSLMLVQRASFKIQAFMKSSGKSEKDPVPQSIHTARMVLALANSLYELDLDGFYMPFQWSITLAFFEIFIYTLSMQQNPEEYEQDIKLVASFYSKFVMKIKIAVSKGSPFANEPEICNETEASMASSTFSNFKFMINLLKNTFESKYSKILCLDDEEIECLKYSNQDVTRFTDITSTNLSATSLHNAFSLGFYIGNFPTN